MCIYLFNYLFIHLFIYLHFLYVLSVNNEESDWMLNVSKSIDATRDLIWFNDSIGEIF